MTRECPILTEKDRADLKVVSNINVVGEEDSLEGVKLIEKGTEENNRGALNPNHL